MKRNLKKYLTFTAIVIVSILASNVAVKCKTNIIKKVKNVTYKTYTKEGTCYQFTYRFNYRTDNKFQHRDENESFYRTGIGATIMLNNDTSYDIIDDKEFLHLKDGGNVIVTFNNNGTKDKKDDYIVKAENKEE
jgi:hypothetical protein